MRRALIRILFWPPAVLAAICCALFFALQLDPVQNYVAQRAIEAVNARLIGVIQFERATFSLTGHVRMYDVIVFDEARREALAVNQASVWLAPWDLALGRVHVLKADLGGVRVFFIQDSSGSNLKRAFALRKPAANDTTQKSKWLRFDRTHIAVDTITVTLISDTTYRLSDLDLKLAALVTDSTVTYELNATSPQMLNLKSDGAVWVKPEKRFAGHISATVDSSILAEYLPKIPNPGSVSIEGNVKATASEIHFDSFVAASKVGSGACDVTISNFRTLPEVRGEMFFDTLSLVSWIGDSIPHSFSGSATFQKSASSSWTRNWSAELTLDSSSVNNIAVEANLSLQFQGETAHATGNIVTEFGGAHLDAAARGLDSNELLFDGEGTISQIQLHRFVPQIPDSLSPLSGRVSIEWRRDEQSQDHAKLRAELSSLNFGKHRLDSVSLHAELEGSTVRVHPSVARLGNSTLTLSAGGSLDDSIEVLLDAEIPRLAELGEVARGFDIHVDSLDGALALSCRAVLQLRDSTFVDVRASGALQLSKAAYGKIRVDTAGIEFSDFSLKDSTISLVLDADSLTLSNEPLRNIRLVTEGHWLNSSFSASASARKDTLRVRAAGEYDLTASHSRVSLDSLVLGIFDDEWRNDYPFEVAFDSTSYEIDGLAMRSELGVLRAAGIVSRTGEQDLALEFSGFHTGQLTSLAGNEIPDGKLNLRLQFTGPASSVVGNLEASIDSVTYDKALISDAISLSAEIGSNQVLSATGHSMWFGDTSFVFSATVPATLSLENGISVLDSLPLAGRLLLLEQPISRLGPWLEQNTHIDGVCSADLELKGSVSKPDWNGEIHLRDGYYGDNRYGIGYKWIMFDAELIRDSLLVKQFRATSKGTLTGSGYAVLGVPWPERLDLTLNFDKFNAVDSRIQKARLDGSVHVVGPFDSLDATGDITIEEGFYRITQSATKDIEAVNLDSVLSVLRGDTTTGGFNVDALYRSAAHRLHVSMPGNFWIRGAGVNIELDGDLLLEKTHGHRPTANGEIAIRQGTVKFYGRELRVQENSAITFLGPLDIPTMDISAAYKGADKSGAFEVLAKVTGTPDLTQLSFSGTRSDGSALSEAEAVSYLLGLRDAGSLNAEEQAISAASGQISDVVGRASKLDVFEFRPGEGGLSDLSSGSLEVGTYITDRLFVRVLQPIETIQSGQTVSIDYRLLDWLKLSAEQMSQSSGDQVSSFVVYLQFEWR